MVNTIGFNKRFRSMIKISKTERLERNETLSRERKEEEKRSDQSREREGRAGTILMMCLIQRGWRIYTPQRNL